MATFSQNFDLIPAAVVLADAEGRIVYGNLEAARLFGYEREELQGKPVEVLLPEPLRDRHVNHRAGYLAMPARRAMAVGLNPRGRGKDGNEFPIDVILAPVTASEGVLTLAVVRDMTSSENGIEALRQSEEKYRALFGTMPEGLALYEIIRDENGKPSDYRFLEVNQAFAEIMGCDASAIKGRTALEVLPALERRWIDFYGEVALSGKTLRAEHFAQNLNRRFDVIAYSLGGGLFATLFIAITARKQSDYALRESEKKYRELVESLPQPVFETDEHGRIIFANLVGFQTFGYSPRDVETGVDVLQLLAPEERKQAWENLQRTLFGGKMDPTEYRACRKDGTVFEAIVYSTPVVRNQKPVGLRGVIVDITDRKRIESELRKLSRAVEQSPVSVVITDSKGNVEYVNPKFTEVTGYAAREALGKNPRFLKSGDMAQDIYRQLWKTISSGREWRGELHNRKKNGDLYWEYASISAITNQKDEITHYVAIKEDITARKHLEQQFYQAQKMEAVGRLAGGVAHDFNNLLTVIIGCSDLMLGTMDRDDPKRVDVEQIRKAGERAAGLTSQLLAFSRKQIRTPQVLDLNTVVSSLERMLQRIIGEDIDVLLRLDENVGRIHADRGQIEQVIMNLAVNARDAMPAGGTLIIETSNAQLDEEYTQRHISIKPGRYALLAISDTGSGMTPEVQSHLFEPFFTTKEQGKGTGLGLSSVYGIVKQNEGYIWVYSEPDRGTTIKIYLPLTDVRDMPSSFTPESSAKLTGTETILVVEDETALREIACRILAEHGYVVLSSRNADEAMQVCRQYDGPIHLLLTDVIMPGVSGQRLHERVLQSRPDTRVLYTSGYTDNVIVHHGVLDPGIHFLQKPFSAEILLRKVREVLKVG